MQAQTASKLVGNTEQTRVTHGDFRWHIAQAFTTGSFTLGYKLTRADLRLRLTQGAQPTYTVQIYSADSSGNPGTSLGTLTTSTSLAGGWQDIQFTASGDGIDLAADTTYLVVLAATVGGTQHAQWADTSTPAEDSGGAAGWSIENNPRFRSNSTGAWSISGGALTTPFQIAIHGYANGPSLAWEKAKVNGAEVTLYFNARLKHGATPGRLDFWFNTASAGTFRPHSAPTVFSNTVSIQAFNPTAPVKHGQTVRFEYVTPSNTANRLQGRSGNFVAAIPRWQDIVNVTPPAISSAAVNGATLVLTFDGGLWEKSVPKASAFTVRRTRSGTTTTVHLTEPVAVRGRTVTLSLAEAVVRADTVTVAYSAPTSPSMGAKLRDADNDRLPVPGFTAQSVTNNTSTNVRLASFSSAAVNGSMLTVNFRSPLNTAASHQPQRSAFAVSATPPGGTARTISGSNLRVAISGNTVTVNLADAVNRSERVTVSYTKPSTNALRLSNGVEPDSFSNQPVTNNTPGTAAPAFESASYAGSVITVNFDGPFTGCADKSAWRFKVDGRQDYPLAVRCKGRSVELSVDALSSVPRIEAARSLTVSYHKGAAIRAAEDGAYFLTPIRGLQPHTTQLQGTDGTDVATFTDKPVTGLKPRLVPPPAVAGNKATLTFDELLDPASRPFRTAFHVTVNGERRSIAAGGVAVAGKTVTLTLASAVAAGETVQVRYTRQRGGLRGASGIAVDSFAYETADNPRVIWSATLTVAEVMAGAYTFHGCFIGVEGKGCRDKLTQSSFVSGGTSYEVRAFSRDYTNQSLQFILDRAIPPGWTWHIDGHRFPVANSLNFNVGDVIANFQNVRIDWEDGQQVSVCLTTGSSATGSANPCPASSGGSADVGGSGGSGGADAPTVTGVEVISNAGADKTYGLGDTIHVRVTFDGTVDVTGTPRLKIDMDPANWGEKWATYETGSGTSSLTFAHTVVEPNYSSQGIAVLENTLERNGGTLRAGGADAILAHDGRDHDANHKVDWQVASDTQGGSGGSGGSSGSGNSGGSGGSGGSGNSGPPTVSGVKVVSDPGDDDTYLLGDTIRIRATFSEAVTVTGSPRLSIDMSPAAWGTKQAAYASGSGTGSLDFTWTVVEPNYAPQGIAVLANSLALNGGTIRSAATNANAALAHTKRDHDAGHKVDWRPEVSVADASANEGTDANAAFTVSLSRAFTTAGHRVTVDYATSDGTATASADYTATSGTLTFAAGEKTKTVNVPILDDAVDEGEETFVLRLSNVQGARAGDLEATGTISNDDPLQKMWLSRFGRTVAGHVTDAVSDRLANPMTGAQVTVAGQRVDLAQMEDEAWLDRTMLSMARVLGVPDRSGPGDEGWPGTGLGLHESLTPEITSVRSVTGREILLGSSFHLAGDSGDGGGGGTGMTAWGRVTTGGFDGEATADGGNVRIDGEVTTGILGTDAKWGRVLAGVALSVSEGDGSFDQPGVDAGTIESTMTTGSPYARIDLNDRVSAWGMAGFGTGDMTIVQQANTATNQPERITRSDLSLRMAAVGGRGALMTSGASGGMDLALRADAFLVQTESEAVSGEGATKADASRMRLILEGSRALKTGNGATLTPGLELGLRHDGGDAETGTGVELGGRISYANPETGLGLEANVRALVAHEDSGYEEWGASGALSLVPGDRGRGLSFRLAPTYGAPSSGVERLWSARDAGGLASGGETFDPESRIEGEIGYGLPAFGDRFTGTPNFGFALADGGGREYRLGWRLARAGGSSSGSFALSLDAARSERAGNNDSGSGTSPQHAVVLRAGVRW